MSENDENAPNDINIIPTYSCVLCVGAINTNISYRQRWKMMLPRATTTNHTRTIDETFNMGFEYIYKRCYVCVCACVYLLSNKAKRICIYFDAIQVVNFNCDGTSISDDAEVVARMMMMIMITIVIIISFFDSHFVVVGLEHIESDAFSYRWAPRKRGKRHSDCTLRERFLRYT